MCCLHVERDGSLPNAVGTHAPTLPRLPFASTQDSDGNRVVFHGLRSVNAVFWIFEKQTHIYCYVWNVIYSIFAANQLLVLRKQSIIVGLS